ncbi:glycoside hydrolase family 88/105 protein [Saccharibacillus alkalitolerans]|uniref:Glycoside hydrolase family 105 protein n=1 Tax=Saccharibacillus alkalitolerans TaxID=2705290 RepID=A0ABX0F2N7_9BACL|nr:glycoside hydrolase family 88 protein [Saccharibacillus alkalitolerans]NGZ73923.1 glycoside hydrolase family 105 protein [Saccharibacillus alkalitolerans]
MNRNETTETLTEEGKKRKTKIVEALDKVTNRLMHLQRPDNESELKALEGDAARRGYYARDFGMDAWDWPQGIGLYGLEKVGSYFGDERFADYAKPWMAARIAEGLPSRNINTTAPLLSLMELPEADALSLEWAEWLASGLPRTEENGYQHVTTGTTPDEVTLNENEIWIDTLFMAILFTAKMGVKYDRDDWRQASLHQLLLHIKYLYDRRTGLFFHGWHFGGRHNFSEAFWCRGNGWFTLGLPEYIDLMRPYLDEGVLVYLTQTFRSQSEALLRLQHDSGLWHTLLDDPASYTETSGSAAIAGGILFGVRRGLLPGSFAEPAMRAVDAVLDRIGEDGLVQGVSAGTPIGRLRDDYARIVTAPMAYGQALTVALLGEALYRG